MFIKLTGRALCKLPWSGLGFTPFEIAWFLKKRKENKKAIYKKIKGKKVR